MRSLQLAFYGFCVAWDLAPPEKTQAPQITDLFATKLS
jgi:hypothetical protein